MCTKYLFFITIGFVPYPGNNGNRGFRVAMTDNIMIIKNK